ncbi:MAG TPA: 23S rRNA (guanosine(2251)-2'-O)-methyltransferase RlmB [Chloroflexota bacterium]|nr:23S rRNA (guanosine(2251)-2'-O)-methyltransferase RlmB [Chloroflexota bacterium]
MAELICGKQAIREALRAGRRVRRVLVADSARETAALRDVLLLADQRGVPIQTVERAELDRLADHHQGIAAEVDPYVYTDFAELLRAARADTPPLYLILDSLQDPQNFGTLLRTAAAIGATGVVLPEHHAVGVTPGVRRASAGAVEHLRVARVTNLVRALEQLKAAGVWVVGLDAHATEPYDAVDARGPTAVVVGSEEQGLRRLVRECCDFLVALPMEPVLDSLNAAVAGSVVLYEYYRQRRRPR